MSYNVYRISSIGAPRDHHALFVENVREGEGLLLHVTGNIQDGMVFQARPGERPETSPEYSGKEYLGWVSADSWHRVEEVCLTIPPPAKQFQGEKRLDPRAPLRRCQEWIQEVIDALVASGVLHR